MKRFLSACLLGLTMGAGTFVAEAQYCTNTTSRNAGDRVVRQITLTGATKDGQAQTFAVEAAGATATRQPSLYYDRTANTPLEATVGDNIVVGVSTYLLEWMHFYLYIDLDGSGSFEESECVSYTAIGPDSDRRNSKGQSVSGGGKVGRTDGIVPDVMPDFTIPETVTPKTTRARFKVDWQSLNPCGDRSIGINRGTMLDFTININAKPAAAQYPFTLNVGEGGSVTAVNGSGTAVNSGDNLPAGSNVVLTIAPAEGKMLESLMVNGVEKKGDVQGGTLTLSNISGATTVSALFSDVKYPLTISTQGSITTGGIVVFSNLGARIRNNTLLAPNTNIRITIPTIEGHRLKTITINGEDKTSQVSGGELLYTTGNGPTAIVATFEAVQVVAEYTVRVNQDANMSICHIEKIVGGIGTEADATTTFPAGSTARVTINATDGHQITSIKVNGTERMADFANDHRVDLVMNSNVTIDIVAVKIDTSSALLEDVAKVYGIQGAVVVEGLTEETLLQIFDLTGRLVVSEVVSDAVVSVPAGTYVVRLGAGAGKVQVK